MPNYSSEEIQAVTDSLTRSTVRHSYDTLGVRRTDITFSDIQESAAGVFLLHYKAPFYLTYLAGKRALEVYGSIQQVAAELKQAIGVLRTRSVPVRDVSALVDAKVALQELERAVGKKAADVTKLSAYARFDSSVNRFLAAVGDNIKSNGSIVQTPEEARGQLVGLQETLHDKVSEFFRRSELLANSIADYNNIGLAQLLSTTVVTNSRKLISERAEQLGGMTEYERLGVLRSTVLDVLATKAAVRGLATFPVLEDVKTVAGTAVAFADSTRLATPASIRVTLTGLLSLEPGVDEPSSTNILYVSVDGGAQSKVFLPASSYPKVDGVIAEPFTVSDGQDAFEVLVDGTNTVPVTLTHGSPSSSVSSWQVTSDITAALTPYGFKATRFFSPVMYDGSVYTTTDITVTTIYPVSGFFPPGSVNIGDEVDFYAGPNAGETRDVYGVITDIDGNITAIEVPTITLVSVPQPVLPTDPVDLIRYGSALRRVRIEPVDRLASVTGRRSIQVKLPTTAARAAANSIGFFSEVGGVGTPTTPETFTDYVTRNSLLVTGSLVQKTVFTGNVTTDTGSAFNLLGDTAGLSAGMSMVVPSGPNTGRYYIESVSTGSFKVRQPLPFSSDEFTQGVLLESVAIGFDDYILSSRNKGLNSSISFNGPTADGGNTGALPTAYSTTRYLKLSGGVRNVLEGDYIKFFSTDAANPSLVTRIEQVFSDGVVLLDTAMPQDASWSLVSTTLPFARISSGKVADYGALSTALRAQLSLSDANPARYFQDLGRLLNPLRVNTNPTSSDIGSAENRIDELLALLAPMSDAINAYQPEHVHEVDELIRAFSEKGADRAIDVLLSCQFRAFFGLTQEQMTYAGAFQSAVRDVAQNDLVVEKTNRVLSSRMVSSTESPDYETSSDDLDTSPQVDPPVEID